MRVFADTVEISISTESVEGGVFSVTNKGATNVAAVDVDITVEDFAGNAIDAANWSITSSAVSQGALVGDTFELGTLNVGVTASIDFSITLDNVSAFPSQFKVKATYTGSDNNVSNDIGTRTIVGILCSDLDSCLNPV